MVQVTRKHENEANENLIRRFNRKVLQSGVLAEAKEFWVIGWVCFLVAKGCTH